MCESSKVSGVELWGEGSKALQHEKKLQVESLPDVHSELQVLFLLGVTWEEGGGAGDGCFGSQISRALNMTLP